MENEKIQSEGMRTFEEEDALIVAQLEAGVRCKWSWSWLNLESKCDVKGKEYVFQLWQLKTTNIWETRPRQTQPSAAKRSIMLPRAPMPFWHIVKVVWSSVYQI